MFDKFAREDQRKLASEIKAKLGDGEPVKGAADDAQNSAEMETGDASGERQAQSEEKNIENGTTESATA